LVITIIADEQGKVKSFDLYTEEEKFLKINLNRPEGDYKVK
jgi:hypothetical protein